MRCQTPPLISLLQTYQDTFPQALTAWAREQADSQIRNKEIECTICLEWYRVKTNSEQKIKATL